MEVRVLGSLELIGAGRPVAGSAKQPELLALLSLNLNRVSGREWLIDQLWAGNPPAAARTTLRAYVYQLRQRLAVPDADVALRSQAGGYLLFAPEPIVDAYRFEQLVAEGRRAIETGRPAQSAAAFRKALRLWRGEAYADIDLRAVRDRARYLDDLRLAAIEECHSVELQLGRHGALVPELRQLTTTHPLREQLWSLLMRALYMAGRQAEALDAYQDLYRLLDDQLGIQPSSEVQRLQQQILSGDPTMDTPEPAAAVPRQLPAAIGGFIGREPQLSKLDGLLPGDGEADRPHALVVVTITGTAGVGKTTLAMHWANRVADRFPDGQLFLNLRGFDPADQPVEPFDAVGRLLDALGATPQRIPPDFEARIGLYRSMTAGMRLLVVLDNARDSAQVRPLLPAGGASLVVVTSRSELSGLVAVEVAHPIAMGVLTTGEAVRFLAHRLGQKRTTAEPTATTAVVNACARLPLALAIVAARAATAPEFPLAAFAADLDQAHGSLDALTGDDPATDVRAVFSWSYQALSDPAAKLFRLLSLHPGPDIGRAAAASLAGIAPSQVQRQLAELTRAHLLTERAPGRYAFHDLLHAYAGELSVRDDAGERRSATGRLLDHYLHTAHAATMLMSPHRAAITLEAPAAAITVEKFGNDTQARSWFSTEHAALVALVDHAAAVGFDTHTQRLAWALHNYFGDRGHWRDVVTTAQAALEAATRVQDRAEQARAHRMLARALVPQKHYADAEIHAQHALDLCRDLNDLVGQAQAHRTKGWLLGEQGRHAEAVPHSERALQLFRAADDLPGQVRALNAVGWQLAKSGDHARALSYCEEALALCQKLGSFDMEPAIWDSLGYIHRRLGDYQQSMARYQHALKLIRETGQTYLKTRVLVGLGDTHQAAGDSDQAQRHYREALELLERLGDPGVDELRAKLEIR